MQMTFQELHKRRASQPICALLRSLSQGSRTKLNSCSFTKRHDKLDFENSTRSVQHDAETSTVLLLNQENDQHQT